MQASYAFRATYQNGIPGLNFSNLHEPNNHWIYATCVCAVETVLAVVLAWYLEQVLSSGTGVRRHPLFFLHKKKSAGGAREAVPRTRKPLLGFLRREGFQASNESVDPSKVIKVVTRLSFSEGNVAFSSPWLRTSLALLNWPT